MHIDLQRSALAHLLFNELRSVCRKTRVVITPDGHPNLWRIVTRHAPDPHGGLRHFARTYNGRHVFCDGFEPNLDQSRQALMHTFYGGGNPEIRRWHIIEKIFKRLHQPGWSMVSYRKTREPDFLMAFSVFLARLEIPATEGGEEAA